VGTPLEITPRHSIKAGLGHGEGKFADFMTLVAIPSKSSKSGIFLDGSAASGLALRRP
jgi:hypothetical protein